ASGDFIATDQAEADAAEKVLAALEISTARIRAKLGESLVSIQQHNTPVEQATTNSLDALKAYSQAARLPTNPDLVPLLKHAIELDPNFASAYSLLGAVYGDLGQYEAANQCFMKAYELRERLTEREKFHVIADYYSAVIGDLDKAEETYEVWQQAYPRDEVAHNDLAYNLELLGWYQKELSESLAANRINPAAAAPYAHLMFSYSALKRLDDSQKAYDQAEARNLDNYPYTHYARYQLAFILNDSAEMQRQIAWANGKSGPDAWMRSLQSDTQAYYGHLQAARE